MKFSAILPGIVFGLALMAVVKANDQQGQQTSMNAAIGLLAIRSGARRQIADPIFYYTMDRRQSANTTTLLE